MTVDTSSVLQLLSLACPCVPSAPPAVSQGRYDYSCISREETEAHRGHGAAQGAPLCEMAAELVWTSLPAQAAQRSTRRGFSQRCFLPVLGASSPRSAGQHGGVLLPVYRRLLSQ